MANIKRIEGKTGPAYKITVTTGRDVDGKQVRHFKTWRPAPGMTERQMEKAAQKAALDFEREIELGYQADNRQSFAEYANYVLDLKERSGTKYKTIASYRNLLQRISPAIGHLKLSEIRPQHLNRFYKALSAQGVRGGPARARSTVDLSALLKERRMSHKAAAVAAGISAATVDAACLGRAVSEETARKLCAALELPLEKSFAIERDTRPLSNKTILEYHRCIHSILAQAEREMIVPYNAADKATPPKVTRKEVNYFQPTELPLILNALDKEPIKWRAIVNLLIVTGCRRGEIAALKWSKVDFKNGKITIDATLLYDPRRGIYENATKTCDIRYLKLPIETMSLLKEYRRWWVELRFKNGDRWAGTDYLFVQNDGKPINPDSISAWVSRFAKRHELPHINPHAFRHTVASVLINNGQDIVTVSRRLGHSRTSTTLDIYSHLIAEADAEASECIADMLLRRQA